MVSLALKQENDYPILKYFYKKPYLKTFITQISQNYLEKQKDYDPEKQYNAHSRRRLSTIGQISNLTLL